MTTRIADVTSDDDVAVAAFCDVYARSQDDRWDVPWTTHEKRVRIAASTTSPYERELRVLALDDADVPVGWGLVHLPDADNTTTAYVDLGVVPERRREHHGTALVEALLDRARDHGRRTAMSSAGWPVGETGSVARRFLEGHGFAVGLVEAQRVLTLPVRLDDVDPTGGYELASWTGACPSAWVEQYAVLLGAMVAEAPAGDMEWEPEVYDAARVRHDEAELAEMGRTQVTTVAVAPDGTLAGHTQIIVPSADLRRVFQWDTLVLPAHRGHRLGLAMKVRNLAAAEPAIGPRTELHTWNAEVNGPMIDVNAAMGFVHVRQMGEMQRRL
ncbi:MAG: GNAT family N-acetyltransferase [Nocardioidaceae bacterium]|nr:GNAT family N-acetyltransferase [Nocardioidaceae bacterium]